MKIDRETFVRLCTRAIKKTRKKITVSNQVSGYLKYHTEFKENDYYSQVRERLDSDRTAGCSLQEKHDKVEHIQIGNCPEIAEYLSVEILKRLKRFDANAEVSLVGSVTHDHVYLQINIKLKNELPSQWEVDAWHPRIIDITENPLNGRIKNKEYLSYGLSDVYESISVKDFVPLCQFVAPFFRQVRPPKPGTPPDATPPREVEEKHGLYPDFTIEKSYQSSELDKFDAEKGQMGVLRMVSDWQKKVRREKRKLIEEEPVESNKIARVR